MTQGRGGEDVADCASTGISLRRLAAWLREPYQRMQALASVVSLGLPKAGALL